MSTGRCWNCGGTGREYCDACEGGEYSDTNFGDDGCYVCGGNGYHDCTVCDGTGEIEDD